MAMPVKDIKTSLRQDLIRAIAKEACDKNDEALRRLSKN